MCPLLTSISFSLHAISGWGNDADEKLAAITWALFRTAEKKQMHRLLPKPLSDLWTGWEASEAAVANDSQIAAEAAREEQVASVMSSLAAASLKLSANAPNEMHPHVEVADQKTEAHRRSSDRTSQLVRKWESQNRSPQFAAMQQQRQALPAWSKRAEIIAAFNSSESRVFLVQASSRSFHFLLFVSIQHLDE
jgi:hypothetical protein